MQNVEVKCARCGLMYDRIGANVMGCPVCKEQVFDMVVAYVKDEHPLISIGGLLWAWPKVNGLPITGNN